MPVQFIEPAIVPDIVVSQIAYMQEIAPDMWRIAFYADQICSLDGSREQVIVAKLVLHRDDMLCCAKTAFRAVAVRNWFLMG